jgi:hypothetical protein
VANQPGESEEVSDYSGSDSGGHPFHQPPGRFRYRVYLDALLSKHQIDPRTINGYDNQKNNHAEIALEVSEGKADVGLGLEAAALSYGLDFIFENLDVTT